MTTTTATPLEDALLADPIDERRAIAELLRAGGNRTPPGLALLERCLAHPSELLRGAACASLRGSRSLQALQLLVGALDDPSDHVVEVAVGVIAGNEDDEAQQAIVAFHSRSAARRVAARKAPSIRLVHLLLADDAVRDHAIDRLLRDDAVGEPDILRQYLAEETLPVDDAARLFQWSADLLATLTLQIARVTARVPPSVFAILDRVEGAWLALLRHREVLIGGLSPGDAKGAWLNLTEAAVEHHTASSSWNAHALIVESTTHATLLLDVKIPLDVRRKALRDAAGLTRERDLFNWPAQFIHRALSHAVAWRDSGVHDLRAAYALVDVLANGQPLRLLDTQLGKAAIVRASPEGAEDLAAIIGMSALRQSDHRVGTAWLEAIARAEPTAFVDVTRTLAPPYWTDVVAKFGFAELDGLLHALADSDASAALWSTWTAAITGSGPSVTALLESRGYRVVRERVSEEQQRTADLLGVPAMIEHARSGIVFLLIPGGEYLMGGRADDPEAYPREKPSRVVNVDAFYLARSPVTQEQWRRGEGPELAFRDGDDVPARGVTWKTASNFVAKLGMRLPREAEWERAARAGTSTRYWWGDDFRKGVVNCQDELTTARPTPADKFPANPWGLFDILGNVWEWGEEWFEAERTRVRRGGCWFHERWNCRASERFWGEPEDEDNTGIGGVRPAVDIAICFEAPSSS